MDSLYALKCKCFRNTRNNIWKAVVNLFLKHAIYKQFCKIYNIDHRAEMKLAWTSAFETNSSSVSWNSLLNKSTGVPYVYYGMEIAEQVVQSFLPVPTVHLQSSSMHRQKPPSACSKTEPAINQCGLPSSVKWNIHFTIKILEIVNRPVLCLQLNSIV
jgi:hypothetical protein